jgi:hypothetical protein
MLAYYTYRVKEELLIEERGNLFAGFGKTMSYEIVVIKPPYNTLPGSP